MALPLFDCKQVRAFGKLGEEQHLRIGIDSSSGASAKGKRAYSKHQTISNSVVAGQEDILIILQKQILRPSDFIFLPLVLLLEAQYAEKWCAPE